MGISLKEKREIIKIAGERHRLYLLAKFNYNEFVRQVGAEKAAAIFEDLKKTRRKDARVSINAYKCRQDKHHVYETIWADATAYSKTRAITRTLRPMKWHLSWVLCSHLILLSVAFWLCIKPWMNGFTPTWGSQEEIIQVGVVSLISFLLFVWAANNLIKVIELKGNNYFGFYIRNGKVLLALFGAPILFLGAAGVLGQTEVSNPSTIIGVSVSIVAIAHLLLILDCMAGLSRRYYYFGPQGVVKWIKDCFKGKFALWRNFSAALSNSYSDGFIVYDDIYHKKELHALEINIGQNKLLLNHRSGKLEFHPSTSYPFIVAYILVDIIHTACLIAWMFALNSYLEHTGAGHAMLAAVVSFGIIYVLLDPPVYATNNFHRLICKNLFAYRVSHLFRKLFFSAILIGGIVVLSCIN